VTDYYEVDFLAAGDTQSGDAVTLRYEANGHTFVHVVDGGFWGDGPHVMAHLRRYYGSGAVSHVVLTHPDGDHAGGLRTVLEECDVAPGGGLWMLRPWLYAAELLPYFRRYSTAVGLATALREAYPNVAALEEIAFEQGIEIFEPFQGAQIGVFAVLAPSKARYLQLIVESERTPSAAATSAGMSILEALQTAAATVVHYVKAAWGYEVFSPEPTSSENEMSVVQYANLCGDRILLTGDVGRAGLSEAADYAPLVGLTLPGIDRFDVPHHGSRRNVSTELLDRWLGPRLPEPLPEGEGTFTALISANRKDKDHPRRAVVRGLRHRGADVVQTGDVRGVYLWTSRNAPRRADAVPVAPLPYPEDQEED
jgi:beta-lactamase superfamily II metal-dependent hydrolase